MGNGIHTSTINYFNYFKYLILLSREKVYTIDCIWLQCVINTVQYSITCCFLFLYKRRKISRWTPLIHRQLQYLHWRWYKPKCHKVPRTIGPQAHGIIGEGIPLRHWLLKNTLSLNFKMIEYLMRFIFALLLLIWWWLAQDSLICKRHSCVLKSVWRYDQMRFEVGKIFCKVVLFGVLRCCCHPCSLYCYTNTKSSKICKLNKSECVIFECVVNTKTTAAAAAAAIAP